MFVINTLDDFMNLFTESYQQVSIWDCESGNVVYVGDYDDLDDDKIRNAEFESVDCIYDPTNTIVINVSVK